MAMVSTVAAAAMAASTIIRKRGSPILAIRAGSMLARPQMSKLIIFLMTKVPITIMKMPPAIQRRPRVVVHSSSM